MKISLTKLPWYAQIGAFAVLSLIGLGAYYYYYETAVRADMALRQNELLVLRAEIARGYATAKKLPEFRAQVAELNGRLENLKSVLPEEKDAADLLRRLQTVATQSNLTIKGFKPSPTITKQLHAEWPIALEFDGTYHNLAMFFDRVGKFTRIINISELDVTSKDKPTANSTITARCVATTFVLLDKPAAPKGPAGKPAPAAGRGV
jgi:type IV pilus assembly protein PilO